MRVFSFTIFGLFFSLFLVTFCFAKNKDTNLVKIPRYNIKKSCKEMGSDGNSVSQVFIEGCMAQEQSAYNKLKVKWKYIDKDIRKECNNVALMSSEGSYLVLQACINEEKKAKEKNKVTDFKY